MTAEPSPSPLLGLRLPAASRLPFHALSAGNATLRAGDPARAIALYAQGLAKFPGLAKFLASNLVRARNEYLAQQNPTAPLRVAVCSWNLTQNCVGRAYVLAQLYNRFAQAELIGPVFAPDGHEIWQPIRDSPLTKHPLVVGSIAQFLDKAIEFVGAHPYTFVHLSKPRGPNLLLGILYKLIWGATVWMDVDDEELAFVGGSLGPPPGTIPPQALPIPALGELNKLRWTQIAVNLATAFDGVTVANAALQARYGGQIIAHARDETVFNPTPALCVQSRHKYGVPVHHKVVLFFGTPRAHKGLSAVAHAIAGLQDPTVCFFIVGDFPDPALKSELLAIPGVQYRFLSAQAFDEIPQIVAMADLCVLPQSESSLAAQFQTPAKLVDACAMGVPVIITATSALAPVLAAGAAITAEPRGFTQQLRLWLAQPEERARQGLAGRAYFEEEWSVSINQHRLRLAVSKKEAASDAISQSTGGLKFLSGRLGALISSWGEARIGEIYASSKGSFAGKASV